MAQYPRGIAPDLLLSQVKNTMPYLFDETSAGEVGNFPPARVLRDYATLPPEELSHFEYFRLCASAHYSSCGTPVPTDVDNQIRHKLWPAKLPLETALEMAEFVLASRHWDFTAVTTRYLYGLPGTPFEKEALTGHLGEWFTLSSGAYCAMKQYEDLAAREMGERIFAAIRDEVHRHSEIFGSLWRAGEGVACLKASAMIAHNFGDLDRVMDMWELGVGDPLRLEFYKLTAKPFDTNGKLRHQGRLWVAGELYKSPIDGSAMAYENHRHFALRKPKCLRQRREFLIPLGPFFDDWGTTVARGLAAADGSPTEETLEIVEALRYGWERLPQPIGYGRALHAMSEVHPGLEIGDLKKIFVAQKVLKTPRAVFEKHWNDEALLHMDDIPSRA